MPAVWPKRVTLHSPRLRRRRAADLALLAKAARYVQALVGTLAELREGAELPTTGRYVGPGHDGGGAAGPRAAARPGPARPPPGGARGRRAPPPRPIRRPSARRRRRPGRLARRRGRGPRGHAHPPRGGGGPCRGGRRAPAAAGPPGGA